jgi:2,5-furandicarboxylate decarboxylase 1
MTIDCEEFRLRRFAQRLAEIGEARRIEAPTDLASVAREIEASVEACWFQSVGPDKLELVAGISGSRRRLALAFETDERNLIGTVARRIATTQPVIEVDAAAAPVQARVMTGDDIDLTRLPFYLQHEMDGGPYISSAIDFSIDPKSGKRNVGCRRLMLRGRTTCTTNLTNNSDLRTMYLASVERGEKLPLSFAIGSHPTHFMAAVLSGPDDEFAFLASLRGCPAPFVRGVSNGIPVPADAEIVLEGYLSAEGYQKMDGPYGEFWGFYGAMHIDPVFHVTAITMRSDVLHQSTVHGGARSARMETNNATAIACELAALRALRAAGIEATAVFAPPGATLFQSLRAALRRADHARARDAIECLLHLPGFKRVVVTDDDVDIFDDQEIEWATSTRFQADRDLVTSAGPAFYEDPLAHADGTIAKMGLDLTAPADWPITIKQRRTRAPEIAAGGAGGADAARSGADLRAALAQGPKLFVDIMRETGQRDGRQLALTLAELCDEGTLTRLPNGEYALSLGDSP